MPLSSIDIIRSLIGDMNKSTDNELIGKSSSATKLYQVDLFPIRTGSYTVLVSGVVKTSATAQIALGLIDFTGVATSITAQAEVRATYQYNALSDQEIQACIDLASAAGSLLAASYASRALAGNAARYFSYTQGSKSINKDNLSKKFLDMAESFEEAYENNINIANINMTKASFDSSGTNFDGYDTASSNPPPSDYTQWSQW